MKRFFVILTLAFVALTAVAQVEHTITIDERSFRAAHTDALTGVNIDPIGKDMSRNACARIKVKMERMSKEEIGGIEIMLRSNNQIIKQKVGDYENLLIFELTAKPNTRFYFHHNDFGDSNEVTLNLEGDREYLLEASLNQQYPITVASNVAGAEVYLDGVFKGRTDSNFVLMIKDVLSGEHTLRVEHGASKPEQKIVVNMGSVYFRQTVDLTASIPQYVVFQLAPANAMVEINGKVLQDLSGTVMESLSQGSYKFTVSAPKHHSYSGTITVHNQKVVKNITLQPAFGYLTLTGSQIAGAVVSVDGAVVDSNTYGKLELSSGEHTLKVIKPKYSPYTKAFTIVDGQTTTISPQLTSNFANVTLIATSAAVDIYVNDNLVGKGRCTVELEPGSYRVESRLAGHRSAVESLTIPSQQSQTINLKAPEPQYGSLNILSTPLMASISLDGKNVGETPLMLPNILAGAHTVTLSKSGYNDYTQSVTIAEGSRSDINAKLTKISASAPAPQSSTPAYTPSSSGKVYKVGDYYNDGVKEGVVFEVSADGRSGKIVSLVDSKNMCRWAKNDSDALRQIGAKNLSNGEDNMAVVKLAASDWQSRYPAFKWCADLGSGWYLPAKGELEKIQANKSLIEPKLTDKLGDNFYFSSTESGTKDGGHYCVYDVSMKTGGNLTTRKSYHSYARAVAAFGEESSTPAAPTYTQTPSGSGVYKVGDYYNDGVKEGVVFEISADGRSGKIVSMKQSVSEYEWCSDSKEQSSLIGASSRSDGNYNMAKIKALPGWMNNYPAFQHCANLGNNWYLPAIDELTTILLNNKVFDSVNKALISHGGDKISNDGGVWYWSSTEVSNTEVKYINAYKKEVGNGSKYLERYVRAVAKFNAGSGGTSSYTPSQPTSNTPSNQIHYTSTDGQVVVLNKTDGFGASVVSNTYKNGQGVITFSGTVTAIGNFAFSNCYNLASITIPESVTSIGYCAFAHCKGLTSITIPNSVISVRRCAVYHCDNLTAFYGKFASADNRCLIVDGVLNSFAPKGITQYTIPSDVITIGESVFYDFDDLLSVTIPNSVTAIEAEAFQFCSKLESITIPASVTKIGKGSFVLCRNLISVYCQSTTPPVLGNEDVFKDVSKDCKIYVPASAVKIYKNAEYWRKYSGDIVGR
ncbi:MAG: PEGA domain-containing protein [Alistipes sp.]|nr:PEGA domain-containing protein [Alistipes sp.]